MENHIFHPAKSKIFLDSVSAIDIIIGDLVFSELILIFQKIDTIYLEYLIGIDSSSGIIPRPLGRFLVMRYVF